jgi:hypothetical protein
MMQKNGQKEGRCKNVTKTNSNYGIYFDSMACLMRFGSATWVKGYVEKEK